jgi:hypothetical protein
MLPRQLKETSMQLMRVVLGGKQQLELTKRKSNLMTLVANFIMLTKAT